MLYRHGYDSSDLASGCTRYQECGRYGALSIVSKELKDTFYFDHYQVRHIDKIERYWNLCLIAWTLTYWIKQNAYLSKILEAKPVTFNEFKQAINSLLEFSATSELSKNETLANEYFKIKSARTVKKLAA